MSTDGASVTVTGAAISLWDVEAVARRQAKIVLGETARARLEAAHTALGAAMAEGQVLYGVNTGFGSLARQRVSSAELRQIQRNLVLSHAAGVGDPLPDAVVRAMLFVLVASLARGFSGVRPQLVDGLVALLNAGVTPIVPATGSVGASGDLAPLAHAALVLIGQGEAILGGERMNGAAALARAGLAPLELEAKEGLALINGTHLMAASAALSLWDIERVFSAALVAAAMSIDACRGTDEFLDPGVHLARGQEGQTEVASRLAALIAGSEIVPSHLHNDPRVQDPYSLRCAPQVLGACLDAIRFARGVVERELGAVTDNPLVFAERAPPARRVVSAGNFHGMPLALAFDTLCIALSHVAGIAERRVYYILAASDSENRLNPHLSPIPGTHSGLMIAQYTAAACCNELIGLATPASVSNIPTSAGMEDYNSFGAYAAYKVRRAVERVAQVVSIELLCAAEALEYQRPLRSGQGVEQAHATVRLAVSRRTEDRPPAPDIAALEALVL
ncbi:MAG TPA: histidine ammonia-lyase, partial [Polyangiaceae bacterium]|nr:histidine ammonia-lyase [Polyangiaceae bacterium]